MNYIKKYTNVVNDVYTANFEYGQVTGLVSESVSDRITRSGK